MDCFFQKPRGMSLFQGLNQSIITPSKKKEQHRSVATNVQYNHINYFVNLLFKKEQVDNIVVF